MHTAMPVSKIAMVCVSPRYGGLLCMQRNALNRTHFHCVAILSLFLFGGGIRAAEKSVLANESISDMDALNNQVGDELAGISSLMKSHDEIVAADLDSIAASSFQCDSLRPPDAKEVYRNDQLRVMRASPPFQSATTYRGHEGLARALNELKKPYVSADKVKVKFKTIRVATDGDQVSCQALVHYTGTSSDHVVEQSADWSMSWSFADADAPKLLTIKVNDFEEVQTHPGQGPWFVDCTESVFSGVDSFTKQILKSTNDWRGELTSKVEVDFIGQIGVAVGDVNGDQREDVFLCQPNGLPNRLYLQRSDGTLEDVSARAGVDWLDTTRSALLLDLDNDGDQDLVCAIPQTILIMENDGQGRFRLRSSPAGPTRGYSICAADYDQDGDLDIYACGYVRHENFLTNPLISMLSIPTPYHDAQNGGPNTFLRNEGDFQFTDVTEESGLGHNNNRFSHAAVWEDFDNDGDLDLYVANDFGRNNLYQNQAGKFADIAAASGTEDMAASMGIAVEDFNKDGWMDIYVSNMFSAAGNRTTSHPSFKTKSSDEVRNAFKRHARGNSLFQNAQDGTFLDVSQPAAVTLGRWAWSSNFIDMNNDGWHDLFVCNGYVTNEDTRDL